ncbi:hypothetical protein CDCA_CDCA16G4162 [Cyanidium caldarium]|uniref:Uncharacterized protein n=1 Tax=Cyanidium caldarium TaxID=2771 RepID=A0AAV9J0N1_CYACA|nr:hypothetical protein CDCA_CDCA16G4162 [Cyanidium caldarium]
MRLGAAELRASALLDTRKPQPRPPGSGGWTRRRLRPRRVLYLLTLACFLGFLWIWSRPEWAARSWDGRWGRKPWRPDGAGRTRASISDAGQWIRQWQERPVHTSTDLLLYTDQSLYSTRQLWLGLQRLSESLARAVLLNKTLLLPACGRTSPDAQQHASGAVLQTPWTCLLEPLAHTSAIELPRVPRVNYRELQSRVPLSVDTEERASQEGTLFTAAVRRLGANRTSAPAFSPQEAAVAFTRHVFRPSTPVMRRYQQLVHAHGLPPLFLAVLYDDAHERQKVQPAERTRRRNVLDAARVHRQARTVNRQIRSYLATTYRLAQAAALRHALVVQQNIIGDVTRRGVLRDAGRAIAEHMNGVYVRQQAPAEVAMMNTALPPITLRAYLTPDAQDDAAVPDAVTLLAHLELLRRHAALIVGTFRSPLSRLVYELTTVVAADADDAVPFFYDMDADWYAPGADWQPARSTWGLDEHARRERLHDMLGEPIVLNSTVTEITTVVDDDRPAA